MEAVFRAELNGNFPITFCHIRSEKVWKAAEKIRLRNGLLGNAGYDHFPQDYWFRIRYVKSG
jgi:hypothetical protein